MSGDSDRTAAVLAAADLLDIVLDPGDIPAVVAHFELLMGFADVIGDADTEPAPVFRP